MICGMDMANEFTNDRILLKNIDCLYKWFKNSLKRWSKVLDVQMFKLIVMVFFL